MARVPRWNNIPSQEVMSFDAPLIIQRRSFNLAQAQEAARYRRMRKGEMRLTPRTDGFLQKAGGLWIPHSGTENRAVVDMPEFRLRDTFSFVHGKAQEKYEGNDELSERQKEHRARFAGAAAARKLLDKFYVFQRDAEEGFRTINAGLGPDGEIIRDNFEQNRVAYRGLVAYVVYLRAFIGTKETLSAPEPPKEPQRKWAQQRHVHVWAARAAVAQQCIQTLPTPAFDKLVLEAYWNERSRCEYWKAAREYHKIEVRRQGLAAYLDLPPLSVDDGPGVVQPYPRFPTIFDTSYESIE